MCTCKPGSLANGWHEIRCDYCTKKERNAFNEVIKVAIKNPSKFLRRA